MKHARRYTQRGSILLEHAILVSVVLILVVVLTPAISRALRSIGEAMPMRTAVARGDVLIVNNPGTRRAPGASIRSAKAQPRPRRSELSVELAPEERAELVQVTERWFVKASDVARARALLMASQNATSAAIARELGTTEATVNAWRREFMAQALECETGGGRTICRRHFVPLAANQATRVRLGVAPRSRKERG